MIRAHRLRARSLQSAVRGMRGRKVRIVALARKLEIALWRFLEEGVIPEGAALKA